MNGGLGRIFQEHPDRRYIMFGGKGGLGKTTFSAATAYYLAKQGHRVLVFSVDPQASLSDIFQRDIFGKGAVEIMPNLFAQEIDADQRIKAYQEEIRKKIFDMYGFDKIPDEIESYIQAAAAEPAMEESAIFDEVVDIVVAGKYDYYIYDLVPLGHALYYLSMASVYDEWIERITKLREDMRQYEEMAAAITKDKDLEEDMILKELQYIKHRISTSSSILTDRQKTAFFFVIIPEEMILIDTQKAAQLFAKFNVPLSGYVVNRVIPESLASSGHPRVPAEPAADAEGLPEEDRGAVRKRGAGPDSRVRARHHRPAHDREDGRGIVRAEPLGVVPSRAGA